MYVKSANIFSNFRHLILFRLGTSTFRKKRQPTRSTYCNWLRTNAIESGSFGRQLKHLMCLKSKSFQCLRNYRNWILFFASALKNGSESRVLGGKTWRMCWRSASRCSRTWSWCTTWRRHWDLYAVAGLHQSAGWDYATGYSAIREQFKVKFWFGYNLFRFYRILWINIKYNDRNCNEY